ncbi:MAG: RNA-directed DNA polymerase [Deltaproteobacteria bacterium]|nr:RNA-directed DNA polymerase [Deltaproteobacteria bacterium]
MESKGVAVVLSLSHLSKLTGASYWSLRQVISRHGDMPYRPFRIPKRSGGARLIFEPHPMLRHVQRWILDSILSKVRPNDNAYAFVQGRNAIDAARKHCGAKWLVKADIVNFFESIQEFKIFKVFADIGYGPLVGFELSRLCTYPYRVGHPRYEQPEWTHRLGQEHGENGYIGSYFGSYFDSRIGHLPQGAPTSPALSNFTCKWLDQKLARYAEMHEWEYTRYADDIVLSKVAANRAEAIEALNYVRWVAARSGFMLNSKKTKIVPPGARKIVLGLLVDGDRPRLTKKFQNDLDMHCHYGLKLGAKRHSERRHFRSVLSFLDHVQGKISFAFQVDPLRAEGWASKFLIIRSEYLASVGSDVCNG